MLVLGAHASLLGWLRLCGCLQAICTGVAALSIVAVFFTPPVGAVVNHENSVRSMNVLVALFFAVDAILKCLAYGVLLTPTAYLQVDVLSTSSHCLLL